MVSIFLHYRICVVCIAPSHSLLTDKAINIVNIDFNDLARNSVSGKKKKVSWVHKCKCCA